MVLDWAEVLKTALAALLAPLAVVLSFLLIHVAASVWRAPYLRRPAPLVVYPLNFEHSKPDFVDGQGVELLELPSRLRDYLAGDSESLVSLAPGPASPITPHLSAAAPDGGGSAAWALQLIRAFLSRYRSSYGVLMVPEVPGAGLYSVGVQVIKRPQGTLVAARSFRADNVLELSFLVGGFCAEAVLAQPEFLRRAPRWEHWKHSAYMFVRSGMYYQHEGDYDLAQEYYVQAAKRCPGNARIALLRGSLHEKQNEFSKAVEVYDAAACLWRQNIDISYRLAAANVNLAISSSDELDDAARHQLVVGANSIIANARRRLRLRSIAWSILRASIPWSRDRGERLYWRSWLVADPYRRPLRLLRKSKRHEYRCALEVAAESNEMYLWTLGSPGPPRRESVARSWRRLIRLTSKRRAGWLAHWSMACYFSRAAKLPDHATPRQSAWQRDWRKVETLIISRERGSERGSAPSSWSQYCEERAVGEIGRVLRNPSSQLDTRLLHDDPDMIPLQGAFKGRAVAALVGLLVDSD